MRQPDLLESHPPETQLILALVVPAVFGIDHGDLPGGLRDRLPGAVDPRHRRAATWPARSTSARARARSRGFTGGILFGTFILAAHALTGLERKAHLPEPEILLVVITTVFGIVLGALGGRSREKIESRASTAPAAVA